MRNWMRKPRERKRGKPKNKLYLMVEVQVRVSKMTKKANKVRRV